MKWALAAAILVLVPATAAAQPAVVSADADAVAAEVNRDYASALAADCAVACPALESMRRAAEHLCALDPGDRCAGARQKVSEATAHVRAACPSCSDALDQAATKNAEELAPAAPATVVDTQAESVRRTGGCAGCATAAPVDGNAAGIAAPKRALRSLLVRRRRRPSSSADR